jgi:hypothetical protein
MTDWIMPRGVLFFILCVFILWILPLGIFISPSKEKSFCGGKRAICLCSHMKAKNKAEHTAEAAQAVTASVDKEAAGFSSHAFDLIRGLSQTAVGGIRYFSHQQNFYSLSVSLPVEHVPKA